jgi:non-canonical poly(A) RNA polymerase PAPD5/7
VFNVSESLIFTHLYSSANVQIESFQEYITAKMAPFAYEFRGNDGRDRGRDQARDRDRNRDPIRDRQRRRDGDGRPPHHQFTFRFVPKPTSERPLLSRKRETTPELLGSHQDGQDKVQLKFAHLDELTDSDEADMEESSSENDDSDSNPPRKKRAVQPVTTAAVVPPKWSNPDPYTALPPPDETQTKRPDFVKLIRKARIAATSGPTGGDAVTTNEDFISFGADDGDLADENLPPDNAPTGPKHQQQRVEDVGAGKKRTRDDQVKVFTGKFGKVSFTPQGDIISVWKARPSDNQTPWLNLMEPTIHLGTR